MDVISNNLANANTIGYKSSRATFVDQFSQTYRYGNAPTANSQTGIGGVDPLQYGLGVKMGSVQMNMNQGIVEVTERPLDMAINGNGFFIYNDNGVQKYSRAGAVKLDSQGYLVDANSGSILQGYNVKTLANGKAEKDSLGNNILDGKMGNMRIAPNTISLPKQTTNVEVSGNLDAGLNSATNILTKSIKALDVNGNPHDVTLTFTKSATANRYNIAGNVDGKTVPLSATEVTFNPDGTLASPANITITAANINTALGSPLFDATTPSNVTIPLENLNKLTSGSPITKSIKIFDQNGAAHDMNMVFSKSAATNQFNLSASIDGKSVPLSATEVTFNADGTLKTPLSISITAASVNAALGGKPFDDGTPKDITVKLGDPNNLTSGSLTQFSGASTATIAGQDGYKSGNMISTEVDATGKILGSFSNGKTEVLGQVQLAKFTNPEGLLKQGGNFYMPSPNSGEPNYGAAVENFPMTTIAGRALEQSNVEMTEQFTDMIATQRAFEAASRTITVSDQMLLEINQLKR